MQDKQIDQPFIDSYIRAVARLGAACGKLQAENDRLQRMLDEIADITIDCGDGEALLANIRSYIAKCRRGDQHK